MSTQRLKRNTSKRGNQSGTAAARSTLIVAAMIPIYSEMFRIDHRMRQTAFRDFFKNNIKKN